MQIIAGPRRAGKTYRAVEWAMETGAYLVTHSEVERQRLIKRYGLDEERVVAIGNVGATLRGKRPAAIGVENLDLILPPLLGIYQPIDLITATAAVETLKSGIVL